MKEIIKVLKFQLESGRATSAPPLGPILTSYNINPNAFVKLFNEKTSKEKGLQSVVIFVFSDKTFDFKLMGVPISKLILEKLNLKKGSSNSKEVIYRMSEKELLEIVQERKKYFPHLTVEGLRNMIIGTAQNMGIILHT
jgi:large subunit ribosomal protein L11